MPTAMSMKIIGSTSAEKRPLPVIKYATLGAMIARRTGSTEPVRTLRSNVKKSGSENIATTLPAGPGTIAERIDKIVKVTVKIIANAGFFYISF